MPSTYQNTADDKWSDDSDADLLKLLSEIAYAGASRGLARQVLPILQAIEVARPQSAIPAIGKAMLYILLRQYDQAALTLRSEGLRKDPESVDAEVVLALVLRLGGRNGEAKELLRGLLESEIDQVEHDASLKLARELMAGL